MLNTKGLRMSVYAILVLLSVVVIMMPSAFRGYGNLLNYVKNCSLHSIANFKIDLGNKRSVPRSCDLGLPI